MMKCLSTAAPSQKDIVSKEFRKVNAAEALHLHTLRGGPAALPLYGKANARGTLRRQNQARVQRQRSLHMIGYRPGAGDGWLHANRPRGGRKARLRIRRGQRGERLESLRSLCACDFQRF